MDGERVEAPVLLERDGAVAVITLNRPEVINALSEAVLAALQTHLDAIAADKSIKAVILRSAGPHFCAGHNLKEMTARRADADGGRAYFETLFARCSAMMLTITRLPQPVIAEVTGMATAAGCQLVATCDLAVAADTARFATSGVNIGLFCSTPMVALSRNIPRKAAMEMLLLGQFIPAPKAAALGLVNRVVPETDVAAEARALADAVAAQSPAAVKIGKEAFYGQAEMGLDAAYAYAGQVMAENMMAQDAEAGIGAFIGKAPMPPWRGV
ncbi:MAG: enoyl-CoA hydratase [Pseudomonadota bacterium]